MPYFMLYLPHYSISELVDRGLLGSWEEGGPHKYHSAELCQSVAIIFTEAAFGATDLLNPDTGVRPAGALEREAKSSTEKVSDYLPDRMYLKLCFLRHCFFGTELCQQFIEGRFNQ